MREIDQTRKWIIWCLKKKQTQKNSEERIGKAHSKLKSSHLVEMSKLISLMVVLYEYVPIHAQSDFSWQIRGLDFNAKSKF